MDHSDLLGHSPNEILMELAVAANACGFFFLAALAILVVGAECNQERFKNTYPSLAFNITAYGLLSLFFKYLVSIIVNKSHDRLYIYFVQQSTIVTSTYSAKPTIPFSTSFALSLVFSFSAILSSFGRFLFHHIGNLLLTCA